MISKQSLIGPNDLSIWNDDHIAGLKELVDLIHNFGSKVGAQISHAGRLTYVPEGADFERMAPSAIPFGEGFPTPSELTIEEIRTIVNEFGNAAKRAKAAGFDILEIHTAFKCSFAIKVFILTCMYEASIENTMMSHVVLFSMQTPTSDCRHFFSDRIFSNASFNPSPLRF